MLDFLKNDSLVIMCIVGVVVLFMQGLRLYFIFVLELDLGQYFGVLFDSGDGFDVMFDVDGELFYVYKFVLVVWLFVFKVQLFGFMCDCNSGNIEIKDIEYMVR